MTVVTPPRTPPAPAGGGRPSEGGNPRRWLVAVAAVLAAGGLAAGLLVATGGTGSETIPTTSVPSVSPPPGSTTTAPPSGELASAVYPTPASGTRYAHPILAARAFAVGFVGFVNPIVGRFHASGGESGTVGIRASTPGAVTTVSLRRIAGSWWVLGSSTPDIRLDSPASADQIASPAHLRGVSTAFEAQVNVEVRQDGQRAPIGAGYVMGGSMGAMAPFDGSIAFGAPSAPRGALVLFTVSAKDGHLWEATVVRVVFAPATVLAPTSPCPDYVMPRPAAPSGEMVVTVFYSCGVDATPAPTYRVVPTTPGTLRTALGQLLAGPTSAEQTAGLTSWFSSATAGYLRSVALSRGEATVDFGDLRSVIPNASSSAGSHMLLAQLDATVFQFPSVTSVIYRIDGSCQTWGEWLQIGGCVPTTRSSGTP